MIECKRHNAKLLKPDTCIKKQTVIAEGDAILLAKGKHLKGHLSTVYSKYKYHCGGCETGLDLYQKSLKGEVEMVQNPMKTCATCKKPKPADRKHFRFAPKGEYQLTKDCLMCRGEGVENVEPSRQKPTTPKTSEKEKTCSGCGQAYPATSEFFQKNKNEKYGVDYYCKTCRSQQKKDQRAKKRGSLAVDINQFPGILSRLEEEAQKNLRTPENQALWILKEALSAA